MVFGFGETLLWLMDPPLLNGCIQGHAGEVLCYMFGLFLTQTSFLSKLDENSGFIISKIYDTNSLKVVKRYVLLKSLRRPIKESAQSFTTVPLDINSWGCVTITA